ncbi:MAG TPA: hypothetical protein ENK68_03885 [Epsilonproteobacteria bacterium]|nr:hypothetical protein [Campylobacterota bacterium]
MKAFLILFTLLSLLGCTKEHSDRNILSENNDSLSHPDNNTSTDSNTSTENNTSSVQRDPLFSSQWYLENTGQSVGSAAGAVSGEDIHIKDVWSKYQGKGIKIAIVDTGIESQHPDLQNVDQNLSYRYSDNTHTSNLTHEQMKTSSDNAHGTACAGIIGAQINSIGIQGIAPEATLVGLNVFSNPTDTTFQEALAYPNVDISSNSWGNSGYELFDDSYSVAGIEEGLKKGRDGKGIIYIFAAANLSTNANTFTPSNHLGVITVAATDADGKQASYSNHGSNILLSAPGGEYGQNKVAIVTTDLTGKGIGMDEGIVDSFYKGDGNYTAVMNGTSAATPMVAAVTALMLEANPNLTYRDVSYILARTARINDPSDSSWHQNGAGYMISEKYGFGMLDANQSVNMAETFTGLQKQKSTKKYENNTSLSIPDNDFSGISESISVFEDIKVEHVDVWVDIVHPNIRDLEITLTSPSGTTSTLAYNGETSGTYANWRFGIVQMLDEKSSGEWKLTVIDKVGTNNGILKKFSLKIYGR